jgi:hypothetical protein
MLAVLRYGGHFRTRASQRFVRLPRRRGRLLSLAPQATIQRGRAALRIAPIEDLGAGDAGIYGGSPCTRCMLTMLPLGTTLPAIGD